MEKAHRWVHTLLLCSPVELLTGEALFQTHDSREHLCMMAKIFGSFPKWMGLDAEYAFGVHSVIQTVFCTLQFLSSFVPFLIAVEVGVGLSFEAHTPGDFTHSFTNTNHRKGQWNWLLGFKQHIFFGWYWEVLLCKPLPLPLPDRIRIKFGGSAEGVIGAVYRIRNFFVTTPPNDALYPPICRLCRNWPKMAFLVLVGDIKNQFSGVYTLEILPLSFFVFLLRRGGLLVDLWLPAWGLQVVEFL